MAKGCGLVLICILLFIAFLGVVVSGVTLWSASQVPASGYSTRYAPHQD